ncbi:hypothetical protein [Ornithinimicrobium cavernae]|uniref:hypothetical protein n=1 Tax=Ornithinimicrobium cavernae TaxID=2666047 RepID=UPI000D693D51|nr:hypothetical protein [Ornithinimicrobium cavernae]
MSAQGKNEGLSLWYRFWWKVRYLGLHIYGPAQLDRARDPQRKMREKRAAKVRAAREARLAREGTQRA